MSFFKFYAGIGSRKTPPEIQKIMTMIASVLENNGYILRSGGANGADLAFESGVSERHNKRIYLPWPNFNKNTSPIYGVCEGAFKIAEKFHPYWENITKQEVKKLLARNTYQILGHGKETIPSDFIICWTSDGKASGGTGQALRIAEEYKIKVFNLYHESTLKDIKRIIKRDWIPPQKN